MDQAGLRRAEEPLWAVVVAGAAGETERGIGEGEAWMVGNRGTALRCGIGTILVGLTELVAAIL